MHVKHPQRWFPTMLLHQEEYTNSYCWVRNTYLLPNDQPVPKVEEADKRRMIPYYQWLPMILLMQALFFYLPNVVWHTFNRRAGVDISSIVAAGLTFNRTEMMEMKEKTRVHMTTQIDRLPIIIIIVVVVVLLLLIIIVVVVVIVTIAPVVVINVRHTCTLAYTCQKHWRGKNKIHWGERW